MIVREPIYVALFALLQGIPGVVTVSRKLKHWNDVPAEAQPALFQAQRSEVHQVVTGAPNKALLTLDLYVYVRTTGDDSPSTKLNNVLDGIFTALAPSPINGRTNLGIAGVEWVKIEGTIETDEGTLGDQAVAIVPVHILCS